ncbi:MAG: AbrB family transcriptional regulator [Pseudomonadota bacterium]
MPNLPKLGLTLAIACLGGLLAVWGSIPLPWMIGAMVATTVAAIAGAPLTMTLSLRSGMVAILGVMLGSSFTPEMAAQIPLWSISLAWLLPYTALSGLVGYVYFRRFFGYDPATSYFSAMPGGLSEMILMGGHYGGDARVISLTHAARILLVVMILPFGFQAAIGYDSSASASPGPPLLSLAPQDLALLAGAAVVGWPLARLARLPAAPLIGPMVLSAVIHLGGLTSAAPPFELVAAAQVVIGAAIGVRFSNTSLRFVARALLGAGGLSLLLLAVTFASAWLIGLVTGLPLEPLILAYAPGGLAEMSLIALALSLDAAFVATHHSIRILLIVVAAPEAYRLLTKWRRIAP